MDDTSPGPVMVGVDASLRSRAAVGYGAWEARTRRRPLRLVHVTEPYLPFTEGPGAPYATDEDVSAGLALLAEALSDIEGDYPDLAVSTSVAVGEPVRVLIREAAHAELLVVGSRHSGRLARLLAGSVSAALAAHATVPVVVLPSGGAPPDPGGGTGPVVVGVDGSPGAPGAVEFAFEEAAARGTDLVAVYAWDLLPPDNLGPSDLNRYDRQDAQREADRLLAEALAGWTDKYPGVGVRRRAIHSFYPSAAILEEAAAASLIVIGPRTHSRFVSMLLGSVADDLLREAHQPIAVVHGYDRGR